MRNLRLALVLITAVPALIGSGLGGASPALGANCGDGVGPCSCGDTVITNTTLDRSDPVLQDSCPCDGLSVESGVRLEIRGTIQGQDGNTCSDPLTAGIRLATGTANVVVTTGKIRGFEAGVHGVQVADSEFSRLQIDCASGGEFGIFLGPEVRPPTVAGASNSNLIQGNIVTGCDEEGIRVFGNKNRVRRNQVTNGRSGGILAYGNGNTISQNIAKGNGGGIGIVGNDAIVEFNQANYNRPPSCTRFPG